MTHFLRFFPIVLFVSSIFSGINAHAAENESPSCKENPLLSGPCYELRGRMTLSNGTPSVRIWPVGTHRILGVSGGGSDSEDHGGVPEELAKQLGWETAMFADFSVCPFSDDKQGEMRRVCVASAKNISIKKWK